MNKTWIIIKREFMNSVSKKSFLILTILTPFLMAALIFVPLWMASIKDSDQKAVAVIDRTGNYQGLFKNDESYRFVPVGAVTPEMRSDDSDYEAVVEIRDNLVEHPEAATIYSRKEISPDLTRLVNTVLGDQVRKDKLARYQIPEIDRIIDDVGADFEVRTMKWDAKGNELISDTGIAMVAGMVFMFLIYMFVMSYGGMVMSSVVEEKTNRIVELMVSSVKPFQLMMGKIVGVALVGFLQLLIWGCMLAAILAVAGAVFGVTPPSEPALAGAPMPEMSKGAEALAALQNFNFLEMGIIFVLNFVGGYLLYASFFAAVGASINTQEDSSQFMMPVVLILIFGLYAGIYGAENPDGPLAFWASLFPLTSPIVMLVRVPFGVPLWEEILSIVILYATAALFVWISAKIYRVGILMYGKKPTVKEMIKWLRYK